MIVILTVDDWVRRCALVLFGSRRACCCEILDVLSTALVGTVRCLCYLSGYPNSYSATDDKEDEMPNLYLFQQAVTRRPKTGLYF